MSPLLPTNWDTYSKSAKTKMAKETKTKENRETDGRGGGGGEGGTEFCGPTDPRKIGPPLLPTHLTQAHIPHERRQ